MSNVMVWAGLVSPVACRWLSPPPCVLPASPSGCVCVGISPYKDTSPWIRAKPCDLILP